MRKKVNNFSGKVNTWLALAEMKVDYYTQFVKSWIPFNAWYMVNIHSDTLHNDRKIIDHLKQNSNPFKDRILSLLEGDDNDAIQFRNHIGQLHMSLEGYAIPSHDSKITFTSTTIAKNPNTQHSITFKKKAYKVDFDVTAPKTTKRLKCEIFQIQTGGGHKPIFLDEFNDWSMEEFLESAKYKALSSEQREKLRLCYEEVNPNKPVNVVVSAKRKGDGSYTKPANSLIIDSDSNTYFIDDIDLVSKVLIEVLYLLRCALFHGEIDPTETNQTSYKHAYSILKSLIQVFK